jgi:hypothetical protein
MSIGAMMVFGIAESGAADAAKSSSACGAGDLTGVFKEIPGGGSLGHRGYQLKVRNKSDRRCFVKGLPRMRLLDVHGQPLPTKVQSRGGKAAKIVLRPNHRAVANAVIADIPVAGENQSGPCQPVAFRARVSPRHGGDHFVVAVKPPTSFCGGGTLSFRPFRHSA